MRGLLQQLFGLTLLDPWLLATALLIPIALWWGLRRGGPAILFAPSALLGRSKKGKGARLPRTWRTSLLWLPVTLSVLGLLCAVVALARPAERKRLPLKSLGLDVLLCVDTSSSMTANDMDRARTRLEVARDAATAFVRGRPEDRIGLIAFARYPDLACPLTHDHDALTKILSEVATVEGDDPEDATGIGTAVAQAAQVFEGSAAKSRVVILLTDGEENVALSGVPGEIAPAHAAQLCEELAVRVYAIVAGTGRRDPSGIWVKPDNRAVERLARRTGGALFEARDAGAVASVYARIDELEKAPYEEPRFVVEDRYLAFLVAGLLLLLLGFILSSTVLEVLP